jgi:hypothetical protein
MLHDRIIVMGSEMMLEIEVRLESVAEVAGMLFGFDFPGRLHPSMPPFSHLYKEFMILKDAVTFLYASHHGADEQKDPPFQAQAGLQRDCGLEVGAPSSHLSVPNNASDVFGRLFFTVDIASNVSLLKEYSYPHFCY